MLEMWTEGPQYHCPELTNLMPPAQRQWSGNGVGSGGEKGYFTPGHAPSMHSPAMNNCVAVAGSVAPQSGPKVSQVLSLINGKSVCALVDSGSTVTIIHPDIFPEDLQWFSTARPLITVTGDRSTMLDHCTVNIQLGDFPLLCVGS